jgi:maltose/moltooligosaccharide transporter
MSGKDMRKKAAKIDYATVAFASLPFMGMISFWQVFDGIIPKMLTQTFGLSNAVTGFVMAIDNIFGLFLLPLFGILSDRCTSKLGRRTPFIIAGSFLAVIGTPLIAIANNVGSLALLISAIILTLVAICMYRTMTVAIVADITPRPLRMKTDSVKKLVGYAGTGVPCLSASKTRSRRTTRLRRAARTRSQTLTSTARSCCFLRQTSSTT